MPPNCEYMKKSIKTNKSKGLSKMKKAQKKTKVATKKTSKPKKVVKKVNTKTKVVSNKKPATKPTLKTKVKEQVKAVVKPKQAPVKINIPFNIGDYAVYPAHGVGKIEAVEEKHIMGEKIDFLVLNVLDTGMNVFIPVKNIASVGLRQVVKTSKVKDVYDVLKQKKRSVTGATWNRRYREYMEKIKSGSVFEIAEVLRDLMVLKTEKDLSFGERKMLDTARTLLVKELALAKSSNEKKVDAEIQKIFSEA
jgi:CarD family transcriptional regulator